jgi:hypothetical protein
MCVVKPPELPSLVSTIGSGLSYRSDSDSFQQLMSARGKMSETIVRMSTRGYDRGEHQATVRASVASAPSQMSEAERLVRERYAWRGYAIPHEVESRDDDNRDAVTLVAEAGGFTVGTLTLGFDGPLGLYVDQTYPDEIGAARSRGRRVCELTRLALAQQADSQIVLSVLFGLAYAIGTVMRDVTDVFIEVNPRHAAFYRRVMGFVVESGERLCERVRAPAVLLRLSIDELEARLETYADRLVTERAAA